MRAHYFQHVPFEGLGSIKSWLIEAGYEIARTQFFESPELPNLDDVDLLIVMGGPMSVHDEAEFPWLVEEKQFIRDAIQAGKRILGICLGAQLIASAMGAQVYRNHVKEIGWFPIQGMLANNEATFAFPASLEVFHWHGETFDLPSGTIQLARSAGCEHQAFQLGRSIIGLQFHLETTPESAQAIISNCRAELIPAQYVQSENDILAAKSEKYQTINTLMADMLEFLHDSIR